MTKVTLQSIGLAGVRQAELELFAAVFPDGTDFSLTDCLKAAGMLDWVHWSHALLSASLAIDFEAFNAEALKTYRQRLAAPDENPYTKPEVTALHRNRANFEYFGSLATAFSRAWNGGKVQSLSLVPGGRWGSPRPAPVNPAEVPA